MTANRVLVTVTHMHDREAPYLTRVEAEGLRVVRQIGRHGKPSDCLLNPGALGRRTASHAH
jgi:hypothetical protein